MRTIKVFFLVSISMFCTVAYASDFGNGSYKTIPVYPRGNGPVAFAVDVRELVYPEGLSYKTIHSNVVKDDKPGAPTAEIAVARYIDAIITQDIGKVKKLIRGEISKGREQRVAAFGKMWKDIAEIRLIRKWSFGDYCHIYVKFVSPKEQQLPPNRRLTGWSFQIVMKDGRYYLSQDLGFKKEFNWLLMLFWYMGRNIREGLIESNNCSHLNDTLELTDPNSSEQGKDNKLIVRFNTQFNKFAEDWSEQGINEENLASDFFCRARKITLEGSDEEFLSLWSGEEYLKMWSAGIERPKIDNKLLEENYTNFKQLRKTYKNLRFSGEQQFKQVCTIDLGKYVVHYYLAKDAPDNLKTIIFMNTNGRYYLSNGLHTNIREFLTRGMVPKQLLEIWEAQNAG